VLGQYANEIRDLSRTSHGLLKRCNETTDVHLLGAAYRYL